MRKQGKVQANWTDRSFRPLFAGPAYTGCMTAREDAHRLLDEVPEDRLADAIDMLRQWASPQPEDVPRRRFRTTAIFDGEHDLGAKAKQVVREAWSGGEAATT